MLCSYRFSASLPRSATPSPSSNLHSLSTIMSFGFSAGDIIACSKLAVSAYNALKDAPAEFEGLRLEVLSLNATLRALAEEASSPTSIILLARPQRQESLRVLLDNCMRGLKQLEVLTSKYPSLGAKE